MIALVIRKEFSTVSFKLNNVSFEQLTRYLKLTNASKNVSEAATIFFKATILDKLDVQLGGEPNWAVPSSHVVDYSFVHSTATVSTPVGKEVFRGKLEELADFGSPLTELKKLKGKLLRFEYKGGTTTGVRIVTLEDVVTTANKSVLLKAVDITKKDRHTQSYRLDKIVGKVETLN